MAPSPKMSTPTHRAMKDIVRNYTLVEVANAVAEGVRHEFQREEGRSANTRAVLREPRLVKKAPFDTCFLRFGADAA